MSAPVTRKHLQEQAACLRKLYENIQDAILFDDSSHPFLSPAVGHLHMSTWQFCQHCGCSTPALQHANLACTDHDMQDARVELFVIHTLKRSAKVRVHPIRVHKHGFQYCSLQQKEPLHSWPFIARSQKTRVKQRPKPVVRDSRPQPDPTPPLAALSDNITETQLSAAGVP